VENVNFPPQASYSAAARRWFWCNARLFFTHRANYFLCTLPSSKNQESRIRSALLIDFLSYLLSGRLNPWPKSIVERDFRPFVHRCYPTNAATPCPSMDHEPPATRRSCPRE
jgi:hypothetical protein